MTHPGKEAIAVLRDMNPNQEVYRIHAPTRTAIIAYVEDLEFRIKHIREMYDSNMQATREAALEEAAKVADDHTPPKHTTALASHVTGVTIAKAIRALKQ